MEGAMGANLGQKWPFYKFLVISLEIIRVLQVPFEKGEISLFLPLTLCQLFVGVQECTKSPTPQSRAPSNQTMGFLEK